MNRARFSCPEQGEYINSISGTMHIKDNITKVSESLRQSRWRSLALGVDHLQLPSPPRCQSAAASLSPSCRPATPSLPSRPAPSCSSPRAPLGAPAPPQPTATPAPFVRPHRDCSWDLVEEMERGKEKGALAGGFHARGQGSTGSLPSSPSRHPYVQCTASGRWALGARASAVASRDDGTARFSAKS